MNMDDEKLHEIFQRIKIAKCTSEDIDFIFKNKDQCKLKLDHIEHIDDFNIDFIYKDVTGHEYRVHGNLMSGLKDEIFIWQIK